MNSEFFLVQSNSFVSHTPISHSTPSNLHLIMAKGLRSKAKRANRAALRAQITIPMQIQRQETIAKSIKDGLVESAKSKSISTLRSAFNGAKGRVAKVAPVAEVAAKPVVVESKLEAPKKRTGSKPRLNVNKELTWFK